jgi:hypothetical protein
VQRRCAVGTRLGRREVRRQRLDVELHRVQRGGGTGLVVGGHREQRLAAIAHLAARERPLVLRNRDHAVRCREVLAGDDRPHPGQRTRARGVDAPDHAVRDRAAADAPHQRRTQRQVGGVARTAGDLFDAVDERRALADRVDGRRRAVPERDVFVPHARPPAAACTDSTIFT